MEKMRKLSIQEHEKTKELYKRAFPEDSKAFLDYYYQYKAAKSQIYVLEESERIASMLHLNPYHIRLGKSIQTVHYIVAVATEEKYRRRGYMRKLLKKSLRDMYNRKEPFTFLMPAAAEIYMPFDFQYIYRQNQAEICPGDYQKNPDVECICGRTEDAADLADFAGNVLPKSYRVYAEHSDDYFYSLFYEQKCQGGNVMILMDQGQIKGYFFTSEEKELEIREAVAETGYEKQLLAVLGDCFRKESRIKIKGFSNEMETGETKKLPLIMGRIVHLQGFMEKLVAKEAMKMKIYISDPLLSDNTGEYLLEASPKATKCSKIGMPELAEADLMTAEISKNVIKKKTGEKTVTATLTIAQLTQLAFAYVSPGEMGLSADFAEQWDKLQLFEPVFLNEVV